MIVGATGNANGKFSGGNATLMSNGSLGLHTMDPQAELHVNGFVNRLGEQTPSDKRLKSNINSFDKGLEEVLKLNPITFSYSKDFIKSDRQHVGLTAQEVQKIVPEFVGTMELRDTKSTKEEYLNIHDNEIKFLLINAIKDQQKMIESQNLEIQKQQSHIEDLTRKVDALSTIQVDDQQAKEISLIHEDGKAVLLQSRPNPNNGETFIEFNIPNEFQTARILFYSMNGTLIKEEKVINTGVQSLKLDTTRLQSGRYTYSLEIDGTLIDSKSMIVAK